MILKTESKLRFLAPNLVTATSITFSLLALQAAVSGRVRTAAWWILYCVLTDKLDGAVARLLNASSSFGMQLDSLSDFLSFGVAPATIFYSFLVAHPEFGWSSGPQLYLLRFIMLSYAIAAAVRLARFNVVSVVQGADHFFFGLPTTVAGGTLCALFAALLKYGDPAWSAVDPIGFDVRLLGSARLDAVMRYLPLLVLGGAVAMVSTIRVPKLGRSGKLLVDVWVFGNVGFAYTVGWARMLPEWLAFASMTFVLGSLVYHFFSPARQVKLPPVFG